jgi:hypothetical protein
MVGIGLKARSAQDWPPGRRINAWRVVAGASAYLDLRCGVVSKVSRVDNQLPDISDEPEPENYEVMS